MPSGEKSLEPEQSGWERPYFEPGGGDAVLSYIIFGDFASAELQVDLSRYRSRGVPLGCELRLRRRDEEPAWFQGFTTGNLGHLLDEQIPVVASCVRRAPACMTLLGTIPDPPTLEYLRDAVGLIVSLLDSGGVAVFDAFGLQWWSADQWRQELFEPEGPVVLRHAGILISEDERRPEGRKTVWIHTRGMSKFGRPDVSLHGIHQEHVEPAVAFANRLIILQALGGVVPEGEPVVGPGLPAGWTCHHAGHPDDPQFNNVHLEIRQEADSTPSEKFPGARIS